MGREQVPAYCRICRTDRLFRPVNTVRDSEGALTLECPICQDRYLDEAPPPRYAQNSVRDSKRMKRL